MEVYEAIEKRRSVRVFKQGVSEEQLRRIILAGTKAPSGSNIQPWEFIIIDEPGIIEHPESLKKSISKLLKNLLLLRELCDRKMPIEIAP